MWDTTLITVFADNQRFHRTKITAKIDDALMASLRNIISRIFARAVPVT